MTGKKKKLNTTRRLVRCIRQTVYRSRMRKVGDRFVIDQYEFNAGTMAPVDWSADGFRREENENQRRKRRELEKANADETNDQELSRMEAEATEKRHDAALNPEDPDDDATNGGGDDDKNPAP